MLSETDIKKKKTAKVSQKIHLLNTTSNVTRGTTSFIMMGRKPLLKVCVYWEP